MKPGQRCNAVFVPYHAGSPRYYDLSGFNFQLTTVTANDCPASVGGALLSSHVCKEVHDRGLMWKDSSGVRRGQELVLWGSIDADNYRYIQEYTFATMAPLSGGWALLAKICQAMSFSLTRITRSGV
jgi:hypothetical protein